MVVENRRLLASPDRLKRLVAFKTERAPKNAYTISTQAIRCLFIPKKSVC
jgi:hypothetical protein